MPESTSVDVVCVTLVDCASFTVSVAKFVKHKVEKNFIDKTMFEKPFVKLAEAIKKKKI